MSRAGDLDRLFFTCIFVTGSDRQNTVGIDVEDHFNLGRSPRGRTNTFEFEMTERPVIGGEFAFTLQYVDVDCRLIVVGRRKYFCTTYRDGRVSLDDFRHHATERFDAE